MNGLPYYKAYPRDFIEGTIGLDFEMKAAYRLTLDLIYMQGGKLPDDARYISGLLGCSVKKWNGLRERLIEAKKLYVSGDHLCNDRADKELETLGKIQDKQRENRSRPNKNKALKSPRFDHTEPDTDTEKKGEAKASPCADGVKAPSFDEFWSSWPLAKVAKDTARKAYGRLSPQQRIGATTRAAEWCASWRAANPRLNDIHPSSYLNQKRWEDEAQPSLKVIHGGPRDQSPRQDYRSASPVHPTDRAIAFATKAVRTPSKDCF